MSVRLVIVHDLNVFRPLWRPPEAHASISIAVQKEIGGLRRKQYQSNQVVGQFLGVFWILCKRVFV